MVGGWNQTKKEEFIRDLKFVSLEREKKKKNGEVEQTNAHKCAVQKTLPMLPRRQLKPKDRTRRSTVALGTHTSHSQNAGSQSQF